MNQKFCRNEFHLQSEMNLFFYLCQLIGQAIINSKKIRLNRNLISCTKFFLSSHSFFNINLCYARSGTKDMKGVEIGGSEVGENGLSSKLEDGTEIKEKPSSNDVSVSLESPKLKAKDTKTVDLNESQANIFVRWNLKARSSLRKGLFKKSRAIRIFWIVLINGIAIGFLLASVIHHVKNNESAEINWCDGVGFLWILYCLVYIGLLYYTLEKYLSKASFDYLKSLSDCVVSLGANKYFCGLCYFAPVLTLAIIVIINPGKSGRRVFSFLGMVAFIFLGFLFSKHPAHIKWRPVICGMVLQFIFGLLIIQFEPGRNALECVGKKVTRFFKYTEDGAVFIFGFLAKPDKDMTPIFAFSVLPVIYFLSFFINILSYYGILQWFIMKVSFLVRMGMGTTVCESVNAVASIFLGMTESPLLIQNYLKDLTKSEICAILCAGWSTIAGIIMAAYIQFGVKASHLIAASVMSAPASLSYSKLIYPEAEESKNTADNIVLHKPEATNALDAASRGALNAVLIIGSIIANVIAFLAFISFLDGILGWIGALVGFDECSFQYIMSKIFYPISFLMGVDEDSIEEVAYLVAIKTMANEFQAYQKLGELISANKLSERSEIIATYALCGFSNVGSIGITIGTLSAMEPSQTSTVTETALSAFIAANIVCFLTACVAGCLID